MSTTSVFAFVTLTAVTSLCAAACTANTSEPSSEESAGAARSDDLEESVTSCSADADCVAIPRAGSRVAQCDTGAKRCKMVDVADIACGAFSTNSHQCPDGYSCSHAGVNPDVGGKCVKDEAPADCRTTGCSTGSSCSSCWGHFSCIPHGALC